MQRRSQRMAGGTLPRPPPLVQQAITPHVHALFGWYSLASESRRSTCFSLAEFSNADNAVPRLLWPRSPNVTGGRTNRARIDAYTTCSSRSALRDRGRQHRSHRTHAAGRQHLRRDRAAAWSTDARKYATSNAAASLASVSSRCHRLSIRRVANTSATTLIKKAKTTSTSSCGFSRPHAHVAV